jgi:hypothetical protein
VCESESLHVPALSDHSCRADRHCDRCCALTVRHSLGSSHDHVCDSWPGKPSSASIRICAESAHAPVCQQFVKVWIELTVQTRRSGCAARCLGAARKSQPAPGFALASHMT